MESKTEFTAATIETREAARKFVWVHRHEMTFTDVYFGNGKSTELPDFTNEVARGVELMDTLRPGWFTLIDPSLLDLDDRSTCILGQVYADNAEHIPGYNYKVKLHLESRGLDPSHYGFAIPDVYFAWVNISGKDSDGIKALVSLMWEHLTATWVDAINARKTSRAHLEV